MVADNCRRPWFFAIIKEFVWKVSRYEYELFVVTTVMEDIE